MVFTLGYLLVSFLEACPYLFRMKCYVSCMVPIPDYLTTRWIEHHNILKTASGTDEYIPCEDTVIIRVWYHDLMNIPCEDTVIIRVWYHDLGSSFDSQVVSKVRRRKRNALAVHPLCVPRGRRSGCLGLARTRCLATPPYAWRNAVQPAHVVCGPMVARICPGTGKP